MKADNVITGQSTASILVSQDWLDYGGNWLIHAETWDFTLWATQ